MILRKHEKITGASSKTCKNYYSCKSCNDFNWKMY